MEIYAKALAKDRNGNLLQEFAVPAIALATLHRDNASTSSVTTLNAMTTSLEVTAVGMGAGIRWGNNQATSVITDAGTANFDHFIPAGQVRRFVVPRSTQAGYPSVQGIIAAEGLYTSLGTKSVGVGSVLVTQY